MYKASRKVYGVCNRYQDRPLPGRDRYQDRGRVRKDAHGEGACRSSAVAFLYPCLLFSFALSLPLPLSLSRALVLSLSLARAKGLCTVADDGGGREVVDGEHPPRDSNRTDHPLQPRCHVVERPVCEREFFIDNLLVRIHSIIETGFAPFAMGV